MSFHAPQAYTKETLAKAFDWLQHQPAGVTQAATTPDNLVAIYLKAQRQGITSFDLDAPNSSRKFIDDLKTLKKEMAPFDESPAPSVAVQRAVVTRDPMPVRQPMPDIDLSGNRRDLHEEISRELSQNLGQQQPPQETQQDMRHNSNQALRHDNQNFHQPAQNMAHTTNNHQHNNPVNVAVSLNMDSIQNRGGLQLNMDARTMDAVNEIQQRFNLGSPQEAIRMLISVGHQHIVRWP